MDYLAFYEIPPLISCKFCDIAHFVVDQERFDIFQYSWQAKFFLLV